MSFAAQTRCMITADSVRGVLHIEYTRVKKMASELSLGIPEDLTALLSNLKREKLGEPVWKLQKRKNGYSVNIFWRYAEQTEVTLFNAHQCQGQNRRKQRSRQRMEAFIEKKKATGHTGHGDRHAKAENPAGCDETPRYEKSPNGACVQSYRSNAQAEKENAPSTLDNEMGSSPDTDAAVPVTVVDLTTRSPDADAENSDTFVDLTTCRSVVYEVRSNTPGVRFVSHKNHDEGWTPVVKSNGRKRLPNKGEGTVINPVRCSDTEKVRLAGKKEIKYTELDGTPGLTFRDGKTRHSYKWMHFF